MALHDPDARDPQPDPVNGILHVAVLDGRGGATILEPARLGAWTRSDGIFWLHLDFTPDGAYDLLQSGLAFRIPDIALEVLTDIETRPRAITVDGGLLVALRGVNMNPGQNPADMVSLRVWITPDVIITSRRRRLLAIQDLLGSLRQGEGPVSPGDFLGHVVARLADRIGAYVDKIEDQLLDTEQAVVEDGTEPSHLGLSRTRRQIANVRRFLAPQRDALEKLYRYPAEWMPQREVLKLREEADRSARYVEDLDLARERAVLLHEEFQAMIAQQQNARMYVLSLVAAIFLPLTFVTGLLGMNVGGLPGVDDPRGFAWSVFAMVACGALAALILRLKKWL